MGDNINLFPCKNSEMETIKYLLTENQMPTAWYNIQADLSTPLPPVLHPGTSQPITPDDLAPLFPMSLIEQEVSQERWIEIPDEVQSIYRQWRPTPLYRARRLEKALDTPAKIYYKYEGVSPAGSHKPNTAVAQAYYKQTSRGKASNYRNGSRTVGFFSGICWGVVWVRSFSLYGESELQPKTLSSSIDGVLRSQSSCQSE